MAKGTAALYDPSTRTVRCVECPSDRLGASDPTIDSGVAGASARREHERLRASREGRIKGRFGDRLGRVILAVTDEPLSTRAWERGARGEEELAKSLAEVPGVRVLNDRRVPGTRGNIDHLVVAPAGVFVVDAKHREGRIQIRDRGGLFRTDLRLYVGSHDRSRLADDMGWQVEAVERALRAVRVDPVPPITPVLCFVDGDWPLFRPPESFRGVRLVGTSSIRKLITAVRVLDGAAIDQLARILAAAFPPK